MIDLHCHSTESDGAVTPAGLVELAAACGLSAIALTDHDTVSGIDAFLAAGRDLQPGVVTPPIPAPGAGPAPGHQARPGSRRASTAAHPAAAATAELKGGRGVPRTVPGVEIACRGDGSAIMHVVGLWMDHRDPALLRLLEGVRDGRHRRNLAMVERLRHLGCALDLEAITALAGGEVVGRPHFAQALVQGGFCRSHRDAFDRFLGRGKPGYVSRDITPVEEALRVLSAAGGVCIWAHPLMGNSVTGAYLRRVVGRLRPLGLDGIEVYYADYGATETRNAREQAEGLGLLQSGGTDFHGSNVPGIALGIGRGTLDVPDALLPPLEQRAREKAALATQARAQGGA